MSERLMFPRPSVFLGDEFCAQHSSIASLGCSGLLTAMYSNRNPPFQTRSDLQITTPRAGERLEQRAIASSPYKKPLLSSLFLVAALIHISTARAIAGNRRHVFG